MTKLYHVWMTRLPRRLRVDYDPCGYGLAVAKELMRSQCLGVQVCIITKKEKPQQIRVMASAKQWEQAKLRKGASNAND